MARPHKTRNKIATKNAVLEIKTAKICIYENLSKLKFFLYEALFSINFKKHIPLENCVKNMLKKNYYQMYLIILGRNNLIKPTSFRLVPHQSPSL